MTKPKDKQVREITMQEHYIQLKSGTVIKVWRINHGPWEFKLTPYLDIPYRINKFSPGEEYQP